MAKSMAEQHYAEALAAVEQAKKYEREGQLTQANQMHQKALLLYKRLAIVESAAQRERLQLKIDDLTTCIIALQQSSDFLLTRAMEQHAAAKEYEVSRNATPESVKEKYIIAAETYFQALNALPNSDTTVRAALQEQLEYIINYISKLKARIEEAQNEVPKQEKCSDDDVHLAALQRPKLQTSQCKTAPIALTNVLAATNWINMTEKLDENDKEALGNAYTEKELEVLRRSSHINGHLFVPWVDDLDAYENFDVPEAYCDPDGFVPLSVKQKKKDATWMRPSEYAALCGQAPVMIAPGGVNPFVVKQDIVTDCSFVASLCIAAAYEQRFERYLITNIIFPADLVTKQPVYNPHGKYAVKLWANGVPRKIVIDDFLPVSASSGQLLSSCTTYKNELWVSLIEKAYLKLNGGYNFPGGNSGIDLFALTGWIPERVSVFELLDAPTKEERLWNQLKSAFHYGDCIITMSTGDIPKQEAKKIGLVPAHVYAVLNVYELTDLAQNGKTIRLLQVKNPWRKMSWKGPYSRYDYSRWNSAIGDELDSYQRQFYALKSTMPNEANSQPDEGLFWMDFESVKKYFESLYLNWNPELFPYKRVYHEHWSADVGPVNDSFTLGFNPQYSLSFRKIATSQDKATTFATSCTVWILLSRHVSAIEREIDSSTQQFLTLHIYRGTPGKRVFYNHRAVSRGTYSNNPHTLMSLDLDLEHGPEPSFTLVVSQYETIAALDYTLSVFSTQPFTCETIPSFDMKSPTSIVISSAWDMDCAGGRPFFSTFMDNPQFHLQLQQPCRSLFLFLETENFYSKTPQNPAFPINLRAALHTRERLYGLHAAGFADTGMKPLKVLSSGKYRPGFCFIEIDTSTLAADLNDIVLIPTTFERGVLGKFTLHVVSDPPAQSIIAYRQLPAEGHGMELTRLRGKWELSNGSAAGCAKFGCYTFNPKYLVHVKQECDILARLLVLEPEPVAAPEGASYINVSVYESTSEGDLLLSTNPKLAFASATSGDGTYVSSLPCGALAKAKRRYSPGWYIVLLSTLEPQESSFELRLFASAHLDFKDALSLDWLQRHVSVGLLAFQSYCWPPHESLVK
ncbi:putative peptidase C2, calpain family, calpain large subunit, domain III superfamily [Plasmopara halstedii]